MQLNLGSNQIKDGGVQCLADALQQNTTLIQLNLEQNGIADKGACYLAN
ncbi:unnamed protein product, partial [Rotaria magnacalcarata]